MSLKTDLDAIHAIPSCLRCKGKGTILGRCLIPDQPSMVTCPDCGGSGLDDPYSHGWPWFDKRGGLHGETL